MISVVSETYSPLLGLHCTQHGAVSANTIWSLISHTVVALTFSLNMITVCFVGCYYDSLINIIYLWHTDPLPKIQIRVECLYHREWRHEYKQADQRQEVPEQTALFLPWGTKTWDSTDRWEAGSTRANSSVAPMGSRGTGLNRQIRGRDC